MNELIRIRLSGDEVQTVSAKELYEFLELDASHFQRWLKKYVTKNDLSIINEDYFDFSPLMAKNSDTKPKKGRPRKEYQLTIPFAKKLCMMSKSAKGNEIREYFLSVEKKLQSASKILPNASNYLIHEQKAEQIDNSKTVRTLQFRKGGKGEYVQYSKDLIEAITGKNYGHVKTWFETHGHKHGITKTDLNKGVKHCIRKFRPHLASTISFVECYEAKTDKKLIDFKHRVKHVAETYKMMEEMEAVV
jgi:phage anti-repressor protein